MTEQEMRRRMHQAMDARLSGLQEDPWLAQRVMNQPKGEKKVKRFTIQTVLAMMLLLAIMGTVYAASLNSAPDDLITNTPVPAPTAAHVSKAAVRKKRCRISIYKNDAAAPAVNAHATACKTPSRISRFRNGRKYFCIKLSPTLFSVLSRKRQKGGSPSLGFLLTAQEKVINY